MRALESLDLIVLVAIFQCQGLQLAFGQIDMGFKIKLGLSGNSKELRKTENRQRHIKKVQN